MRSLYDINSLCYDDNPMIRWDAVQKLSVSEFEEAEAFSKELSKNTPQKAWPYGMPTSLNPWLLFLGVSPGKSGDKSKKKKEFYDAPTIGKMHEDFMYPDTNNFWNKIRFASKIILSHLGLRNWEECYGSSGLMNLSDEEKGDAKDVKLKMEMVEWVIDRIRKDLRPRFIIAVGLKDKEKEKTLKSHFSLVNPEEIHFKCVFRSNGKEINYSFEVYDVSSVNYKQTFIFWPQHPSRPPMTIGGVWEESVCVALKKIICKRMSLNNQNNV